MLTHNRINMPEGIVLKKTENTILKLAAVSAAVIALFNAYSFYKNNVWKPNIEVQDVDYAKGVAHLLINGRNFTLRGDSSFLIGYDWGIRFGTTIGSNKRAYDRIEVLKRGMVVDVIRNA